MRKSNLSLFISALALMVFSLSACGKSGQVQGENAAPSNVGTVSSGDSKPVELNGCAKEEFKSDPLCQSVVAGSKGSLTIGNTTLKGIMELGYYEDGKIESARMFADGHPDQPSLVKEITYDQDGKEEGITVKLDNNFTDNAFDVVENRTLTYQNGKLLREDGSRTFPSNPSALSDSVMKVYWDANPNILYKMEVLTEAITGIKKSILSEIEWKQSMGGTYLKAYSQQDWVTATNSLASTWASYVMTKKDGEGRLDTVSFIYAPCHAGSVQFKCDPSTGNMDMPYVVTTKYNYEGDKLLDTTTEFDGDLAKLQDPTKRADGTPDRTIACAMSYDETRTDAPVGFPKELKELGFSDQHFLQSIKCTEGGQQLSEFQVEYKPLWEAAGVMEPGAQAVAQE